MPDTHWLHPWCWKIGDSIDRAVLENWPRPWEENDITTSILRTLCTEHRAVTLKSIPEYDMFTVEWDAFKLNGDLERDRGDVAVLVRFYTNDPEPLQGVGYFEAKKIYTNGRFDGITSWEQLERMRRNIPHHQVVFYDFEPSTWNQFRPGASAWQHSDRRTVNCLTMPTNRAVALRKKTRDLYLHCTSFCEQLCLRYIQGFDLEFEKYHVEDATEFIERYGGTAFLLVANVVANDGTTPLMHPEMPPIKVSESYTRISHQKPHKPGPEDK